ncbi:Asp23/Gls24 family envelope stress response protein [Heliophilum fasciatum]|uniref:Putative alkaline shock family protein YloU n=1 Tax=Heliophilum fasciatum TaxID=35700 RepID=A0A4R2RW21_9FIRM|nr:Asp23/Gls24 family envelope stress response protein [Heliophilum fasciatum]MCW2277332.1 putative alkaline shock family protein YloU [Heliophilum fasciatum]TCP67169.1 putative alkaline shock family protein YloU [Heliophilum fasciatum]
MEQEHASSVGHVRIAEDVVATIAGMAASEVPGVSSMSGGIGGGIVEMIGKKNLTKGVKVEVGEKEAAIDLNIIVEFGSRIPDVARRVQERVKDAVEGMTGLSIVEVNVHIQGVNFANQDAKDEERVKK